MIYAKSNPVETLREHTDALIEQLKLLQKYYGKNINNLDYINKDEFWKLLDIFILIIEWISLYILINDLSIKKVSKNQSFFSFLLIFRSLY